MILLSNMKLLNQSVFFSVIWNTMSYYCDNEICDTSTSYCYQNRTLKFVAKRNGIAFRFGGIKFVFVALFCRLSKGSIWSAIFWKHCTE